MEETTEATTTTGAMEATEANNLPALIQNLALAEEVSYIIIYYIYFYRFVHLHLC